MAAIIILQYIGEHVNVATDLSLMQKSTLTITVESLALASPVTTTLLDLKTNIPDYALDKTLKT